MMTAERFVRSVLQGMRACQGNRNWHRFALWLLSSEELLPEAARVGHEVEAIRELHRRAVEGEGPSWNDWMSAQFVASQAGTLGGEIAAWTSSRDAGPEGAFFAAVLAARLRPDGGGWLAMQRQLQSLLWPAGFEDEWLVAADYWDETGHPETAADCRSVARYLQRQAARDPLA